MAGYGMTAVDPNVLPAIELPPTTNVYEVILRGNYDNVDSRGSAPAATSTIQLDGTLVPWPVFEPGELVAIESAVLGVAEVRMISAFDPAPGASTSMPPW